MCIWWKTWTKKKCINKVFQFLISVPKWAALTLPLFGWLMSGECNFCGKISSPKQKAVSLQFTESKQREPVNSGESSWAEMRADWSTDLLLNMMDCGVRCHWDQFLFREGLRETSVVHYVGQPAGSPRCHLHTNVTNPSGVTHLHTTPPPHSHSPCW